MKIKRTVPDFKTKIPDRIEIGKEYWHKQVVQGEVNPDIYNDIESENRLRNEEKNSILDVKLSDNTKIIKVEDFRTMMKKIELWILELIVKKLLAPGVIEKYLTIIFKALVSSGKKLIEMLSKAAEKTDTKIDDQIMKAISNGYDHYISLLDEKEKSE